MALTEDGQLILGAFTEDGDIVFSGVTEDGVLVFGADGGSTTYTHSVGGVLSPSGTINCSIKLVENIGNAVITPVGTITKSIGKTLSGTLGTSGHTVKQVQKNLSGEMSPEGAVSEKSIYTLSAQGEITPSGALTRAIKLLANIGNAVITPIGTVSKLISKSISGLLDFSGNVIKQTEKTISGEVIPTGEVSQKSVYTQSALGEISPAGILNRVATLLTDIGNAVITPVGTIAKMIGKNIGGAVGPSGGVSKQTGKVVSGSITPIGTITKGFVRAITVGEAVISFVGTLVYESVVVEIENLLNRAFKGLKNFFH